MQANHEIKESFYLKAVLDNPSSSSKEAIIQNAKSNPQFNYDNINFEKFNAKYSSNGWVGRKILAIPMALFSGIIKTIYHLAIAILIGIPRCLFGNSKYLKSQIFSFVRDLQESLGFIITLFKDNYGLYNIQKSQFNKSCYSCFACDSSNSLNTSPHTETLIISQRSQPRLQPELQPRLQPELQPELQPRLQPELQQGLNNPLRERREEPIADTPNPITQAKRYVEVNNVEKSLKAIREITDNDQEKQTIVKELIENLLNSSKKNHVPEIIEEFILESNQKNNFYYKLANKYPINTPEGRRKRFEIFENLPSNFF